MLHIWIWEYTTGDDSYLTKSPSSTSSKIGTIRIRWSIYIAIWSHLTNSLLSKVVILLWKCERDLRYSHVISLNTLPTIKPVSYIVIWSPLTNSLPFLNKGHKNKQKNPYLVTWYAQYQSSIKIKKFLKIELHSPMRKLYVVSRLAQNSSQKEANIPVEQLLFSQVIHPLNIIDR